MSPRPVTKKRNESIIEQSPVVENEISRIVILPGGVGTISGKSSAATKIKES